MSDYLTTKQALAALGSPALSTNRELNGLPRLKIGRLHGPGYCGVNGRSPFYFRRRDVELAAAFVAAGLQRRQAVRAAIAVIEGRVPT